MRDPIAPKPSTEIFAMMLFLNGPNCSRPLRKTSCRVSL
jgi:hypothetical protein